MEGDGGVAFSFVGDRVSMAWAGGRVSSKERLSKEDFGGGWRRRGEVNFVGGIA